MSKKQNNVSEHIDNIEPESGSTEVMPEERPVFTVIDLISMQTLKDLYINFTMSSVNNNIKAAAKILGISDRTIYNRVYAGKVTYSREKKNVQNTKRDG